MLRVEKIYVKYGEVNVIRNVSLTVNSGEFVSIIGSNGAGKSTIVKTISGLFRPFQGKIFFLEVEINLKSPHETVEMGISHIPEGRKLFSSLSVLENLELGAYTPRARGQREENIEKIFKFFPILQDRKNQLSGTLSGGEQQMLAIGRGLISDPTLLIFDEPSLGLAPIMVNEIIRVIKKINGEGKTILLVEQNVRHALANSDRAYVLENGTIKMEGTGEELMKNKDIKTAYLGL
jgi:branched-chain amino acid transport system ATP-binding protein